MKQIIILWLTLSILCAANVRAQTNPAAPDFAALEQTINAELREKHAAGAAVVIVSGERIVYAKGFGTANSETGASVTPDTLFQTGSITKTFTALAINQLALEGKLKLDAPVGDYAAGLNPNLARLTLAQLLSHTSGIIDEPDEYGAQDESQMAVYLRSWSADYALLDPALHLFSYSNAGYALAGFAMQEALQTPYTKIMQERVFASLGMTRATFAPTVAMTYPLAVGHKSNGENLSVVRPLAHDARLYPAGTFYVSGNDLARLSIAFLNDGKLEGKQVIAPAAIQTMMTPHAEQMSAPTPTYYGNGFFIDDFQGVKRYWHDGSMTGYVASLALAPKQHFAVIILGNTDGVSFNRTQAKAFELMHPSPTPPATVATKLALPLDAAELQSYVGSYTQPKRWTAEVFIREGKLYLKQFGRELPLTKIGTRRFRFQFPTPAITQELYFSTDAQNKIIALNQFVWAFKRQTATR